jgi:hypothetical protein
MDHNALITLDEGFKFYIIRTNYQHKILVTRKLESWLVGSTVSI